MKADRGSDILRWMRHPSATMVHCLVVLAAISLGVRVGGAHLHLCFDGSEPPRSLHIADDCADHSEAGYGPSHNDRDVSLAADFLTKKYKGDERDRSPSESPISIDASWLASSLALVDPRPTLVFAGIRLFLRPPMRGPPR